MGRQLGQEIKNKQNLFVYILSIYLGNHKKQACKIDVELYVSKIRKHKLFSSVKRETSLKALALPKSLHYFDPNPGFLRSQDLMVT
jgi:hypothetical protein